MYNKGWVIRKLDIINHKVVHEIILFVLISVLQLGVQAYNFEHKYITNYDTILFITMNMNEQQE